MRIEVSEIPENLQEIYRKYILNFRADSLFNNFNKISLKLKNNSKVERYTSFIFGSWFKRVINRNNSRLFSETTRGIKRICLNFELKLSKGLEQNTYYKWSSSLSFITRRTLKVASGDSYKRTKTKYSKKNIFGII